MFSGPMFRWEFKVASRLRGRFAARVGFAIVLGIVALMIGLIVFATDSRMSSAAKLGFFGRSLFLTTVFFELLFLLFFVPSHVASAIAEERSKGTLPLLLLTRLWPIEIVTTKAVARWLPSNNPILTGLPSLVASAWAAGLEWEAAMAVVGLISCSGFMAALAILASARREQAGTARAQAMVWTFGWLILPPFVTIIPVATASAWAELLYLLKSLCALVAPSSPLSLLTDNAWYYRRPGLLGLEGRLALMIGLQGLFGLVMLGLAAGRLKAREKNPNWLDPTRGHRPACGDDPILWREFDLPMRRGAGPMILLRLRYAWILIRAILISLLSLLGLLLTLAVPIGLLVATYAYGTAAFRELWGHGYGPGGPFEARGHFNTLVRVATGLLALLPILGVASIVSGRITTERDKKTWDAFLTTPLEGDEILRSKALVAAHGLWQNAWPLPILWAIGLGCGVILPVGVALATVDLLLAAWANVALGLTLGLRPGTTSAASNRSSWWMLFFLLIHTPLLWAALVSPREFAEFASWSLPIKLGLGFVGLAVPISTGLLARHWTALARARFDEWAGRPIASGRINPP